MQVNMSTQPFPDTYCTQCKKVDLTVMTVVLLEAQRYNLGQVE